MAGKLERQIKKRNPFASPQQAAVLGILRTADMMQYRRAQFLRDYELTQPQYNVLRILRGEGKPLPSLEIANRMITMVPAITALIDRLEARKLVSRERSRKDRRVWLVNLTETGKKLLAKIDEPLLELEDLLCAGLNVKECQKLVQLLEQTRAALDA